MEPAAKIQKMSSNGENTALICEHKFTDFRVTKILNEIPQLKTMFLEGRFGNNENPAVVILEKTAFSEEAAKSMLTKESETKEDLKNDIYHSYQLFPDIKLNGIKTTLIYPATDKHIAKYAAQDLFLVEETADDYNNITLPYIQSTGLSIQWVYNILDHKKEADRIVAEDPDQELGFLLLPDLKWDRKQIEDLYLVAIVHRHGIKSIRDLRAEHLPLLRNVMDKGCKSIHEKYGVSRKQLRIYFHYQPSYYHLHIHFTHLHYDAPGSGVVRAHLLCDVIDNIERDPDFYAKKTIAFALRSTEGLCEKFRDAGRV